MADSHSNSDNRVAVLLLTVIVAASCQTAEPEAPVLNVYDVMSLDVPDRSSDALFLTVDIDGTGASYNPLAPVLFNFRTLTTPDLPTLDEATTKALHDRFRFRFWVESSPSSGTAESIDLYTWTSGDFLDAHAPGEIDASRGAGFSLTARGGTGVVPLSLMFDPTESMEPGWFETPVAIAIEYPADKWTMTGRIGFAVSETTLHDQIIPAITHGLDRVWSARPDTDNFRLIDADHDGAITNIDVAYWVDALADPDLDVSGDGIAESYSFSFGFRAHRTCGGDEWSCHP